MASAFGQFMKDRWEKLGLHQAEEQIRSAEAALDEIERPVRAQTNCS